MAGKKKFGAFAGVFTPSLLTILGVIMYMRMGWVVGNAGLIGTLIIILIAHVISISTGLSISSIATDKKVGAGGIYYILSRSMGIPIGGAIGLTLYVGTAFSIALYLIGFAESFNGYFDLDTGINGLRITGSIALLVLTAIALISTSVAIKTQFFILGAIVISLISIFFGTHDFAPENITTFTDEGSVSLEIVFAIFFPAVTGFTAGIAMSGDLKNPKKDIPAGTIASIAVGFFVYVGLAIFLANYVDSETLRTDYNILMKIALFAPAVVAGIWGATLSSALGGVLGGPRILQAMSIDKITPRFFGRGKGKNNEPVNALLLVFIIAFSGILIGELDIIARVVSMFYLAAYGVINLSFFLENWANPDFRPTFKVKRWIGLLGFIASFAVMFKLDVLAMVASIIVILGIYIWLQRKQIALESGDVWQSVWQNVVAKGLKKLDAKESDIVNWRPNMILFSRDDVHRSYLAELSRTISGRTGIITNFNLILDKDNKKTFSKESQIVKNEDFEKLNIFAKQVRVDNIFEGIGNIASTFGFSGVEPNTIMMGWPRNLSKSTDYAKLTQRLLRLDYNLLYLDFDRELKYGNYETVDLWWRETDGKNAEMMLSIARFLLQSPQWNNASIRVLFVNHNNIDNQVIKSKISKLVKDLRVTVSIKIINNGVEQKSFYDIISLQSAHTDLTIVGIPNIQVKKQAEFIVNTNHLFETIGSTLMIKASNNFNELELDLSQEESASDETFIELKALPIIDDPILTENILELDENIAASLKSLSQPAISTIVSFYTQYLEDISQEFSVLTKKLDSVSDSNNAILLVQSYVAKLSELSVNFRENKLYVAGEVLDKGVNKLINSREEYLQKTTSRIKLNNTKKIKWRNILNHYFNSSSLPNIQNTLGKFGANNYVLLNKLVGGMATQSNLFIEHLHAAKANSLSIFKENVEQLITDQKENVLNLKKNTISHLQNFDRSICVEIMENYAKPKYFQKIQESYSNSQKKKSIESKIYASNFANIWLSNQTLSHSQSEISWQLLQSSLSLVAINETIKSHLKDSLLNPQGQKLKLLSKALDILQKNEKKDLESTTINKIGELAEGVSHVNLANLFEEEEKRCIAISYNTPKSVELMSPVSFNLLFNSHEDSTQTISINLYRIQNHIVQSDYLAPLHDILRQLEEAYNQNSEEIYNSANHISQLINELQKDNNTENEGLISEEQKNIEAAVIALRNLTNSFSLDLSSNLRHTQDNLDIKTIIDSADLLSKASQKPIIKSRFQEWLLNNKESIKTNRTKLVEFINKHRQEIDTLKFDERHRKYFNRIEQTRAFINNHELAHKVSEALPFYYKKLFAGSHLAGANISHHTELNRALKVIDSIKSGNSGALMIIGDSLSGKTHFSETLVKALGVEKLDVNPPENQNYTSNDLHLALQKIFTKKGTSFSIINQLKKSRAFVFNDIEKWWTRSKNGSKTLDYLVELIEKVGDKHFFILNCNKYSYQIIKETTQLENKLLATIIMRPLGTQELKSIVLNRHKIGGAEVYYKNDLVQKTNKTNEIINKIHALASGNVGASLHLWLTSISSTTGNELHLNKPKVHPFPTVYSAEWKLLLYHFILHKNLSEQQLKEMFGPNTLWPKNSLLEIQKAGLVLKQPDGKYRLQYISRFYIENWLKSLSFLN